MISETIKLPLKKGKKAETESLEVSQPLFDFCYSKMSLFGFLDGNTDTDRYFTWALAWRLAKIGKDTDRGETIHMAQRKSKTILLLRLLQSELKNDHFDLPEDEDFVLLETDVVKAYSIIPKITAVLEMIDDDQLLRMVEGKFDLQELRRNLAQITPEIALPKVAGEVCRLD